MAITTLARKIAKVIFYFALSLVVGRTLGSPEIWFNYAWATRIAHFFYGEGEIGADNFYDLYFYISVISVFSITTAIYILTMKLLRKIRSS